MEVVILDFETTGFSVQQGHRVTEVAAAVVAADGSILDLFEHLCNPGSEALHRMSQAVVNLTGITKAMLLDQPPCGEVILKLAEFIADRPVVAHNAKFDVSFLRNEMHLLRYNCEIVDICTCELAKRLLPQGRQTKGYYKLTNLASKLQLAQSFGKAHRAMADVHMTVQLWNFFLAKSGLSGSNITPRSLRAIYMQPTIISRTAFKPAISLTDACFANKHTGTETREAGKKIVNFFTSHAIMLRDRPAVVNDSTSDENGARRLLGGDIDKGSEGTQNPDKEWQSPPSREADQESVDLLVEVSDNTSNAANNWPA